MIELLQGGYLIEGEKILHSDREAERELFKDGKGINVGIDKDAGRIGTMAGQILRSHNAGSSMKKLQIKFDKLTSHDITYVGIIQTARASGLKEFPIPYVLTNCHNSLCAVGGTINEDDHMFGLTCAKKYGGVYVPPHMAVIHQYAREMMTKVGSMILGSDSHTRYGALGTMAIGEGGPELVKQLLSKTYDIDMPQVVGVYLKGAPKKGVGPQDVALAIIKATFESGFVKNKIMEFVGPGIKNLSVDYRIGIDVMTTETTCLSSIWQTDEKVREYYEIHGREDDFSVLKPFSDAYYDSFIVVDLDEIEPMIAMPFHPSNVYTIKEVNENPGDVLREVERRAQVSFGNKTTFDLQDKIRNGKLYVDQGIIAGCAGGGYENICQAADILRGKNIGSDKFALSVYPASMPIYSEIAKNNVINDLVCAGAVVKTAFCGPCFGAGDTPANGAFSIRHSTRNFPNREGSKIGNGQISYVALMDARSIAATAANKGVLTSATDMDYEITEKPYYFNGQIYENRVFDSHGKPDENTAIQFGPNIKDWPKMSPLPEHLILKVVSKILDPVTTTDELIPSGETSSYRSNPEALAEFTLSRKDPLYVERAKQVREAEKSLEMGMCPAEGLQEVGEIVHLIKEKFPQVNRDNIGVGSTIFAVKPGDGSAREQAASCQKVLGGWANIANSYATKRYRSNLINWGMLPLVLEEKEIPFDNLDYIFIPNIRKLIESKESTVTAYVVTKDMKKLQLSLGELTDDERDIILKGCLINYYQGK